VTGDINTGFFRNKYDTPFRKKYTDLEYIMTRYRDVYKTEEIKAGIPP
jgi:hypothetical protein